MMSTFLRRLGCVALTVLLSVTLVSAHTFNDVPSGHWAESSISRGVELGLFNGTSTNTFGMGESMSRGAFMVVLGRMMDWESVTPTTSTFSDVSTSSWYFSAIETALANEALTTQASTFRPDDPLTREELAAILARALGYGTLAGLVQDLSTPFTDVTTNRGYIAIVSELGLMTGTATTAFSPSAYATREQVAVTLMRLWDKLHVSDTVHAIVSDLSDVDALTSHNVVALPSATLSSGSSARINPQISTSEQQAAISVIHENDGTALLYLTGGVGAMRGEVEDTVDLIVAYLDTVGYDGVFLDIEQLTTKERTFYTQLIQALDPALDGKTLAIMVEAPAWQTTQYNGYDYATLSQNVDTMVLRIAPYALSQDTFLIAPVDPLEEVYYALTHLPSTTDLTVVSLLVTTTGYSRTGTSGNKTITGDDIATLLAQTTTQVRTSDRYDCDYLMGETTVNNKTTDIVAWYLSGEQVQDRIQLGNLFSVNSLFLSDACALLPDVDTATQ